MTATKKTTPKKSPAKNLCSIKLSYEEQQAAAGWIRLGDARVKMDAEEAQKILRIRDELRAELAKLPDGRVVNVPLDAIRWVFINQIQMQEQE